MSIQVNYAQISFDFVDAVTATRTLRELRDRLASFLGRFGYDHFLLTGVPDPAQTIEPHFLVDAWPAPWSTAYVERGYYPDDPIARHTRQSVSPFAWSDVVVDPERWPRAGEVMAEAASMGLVSGFSVPIVSGTGEQSCLTMGGREVDADPAARKAIHVAGLMACAHALTLATPRRRSVVRVLLTPRERDIMQWIAAGRSNDDIAEILGISERTVRFHLTAVMDKFGSANRTQAVVDSLRAGEIRL